MQVAQACRFCGRSLPGDAPRGLCPGCLLSTPLSAETGAATGLPNVLDRKPGRLGDYELLAQLAEGGMGIVYFARQAALNRSVALKMIRSGHLATALEVQRFRTEAEAAATLDHPNIVPIYDVGEADGWHYFSMKLIEGGNLAEWNVSCPSRDVPWCRKSAEIVAAVARAVHHAHQRGVLHRDIKPTNVLLDECGRPHLTDFGLAKLLRSAVSQTTGVLGTPTYMAPEQAGGRQVTTAADIYSLGAILYDLLCGRPPFEGDSPLEIMGNAKAQEPAAPRRLNPLVPRDLETICLKCLEKNPGRRYASAEALAEDLQRWLRNEPIQARAVTRWERSWKWARRNPALSAAAAALVLLLLAGSAVALGLWRRAETSAQLSAERLVRLNVANGVRLLDDHNDHFGALVWFAEALKLDRGDPAKEENHRLRLASTLRQCPTLVQFWAPGGPVHDAQFSPDGNQVLAAAGSNTVSIWNARTGETAFTLEHPGGSKARARFSSRGDYVLSYGGNTARIWHANTGRLVADLSHPGITQAAIHAAKVATAGENVVKVWTLNGRLEAELAHASGIRQLVFSPHGAVLLAVDRDSALHLWQTDSWTRLGPPVRSDGGIRHAAFDAAGRRIVTAHADGTARIWDAVSGELLAGNMNERTWLTHATFSPDGKWIATSAGGHVGRIWNAETGKRGVQLSGHKNVVVAGAFSPNGDRVVTCSFDGTARVHESASGWAVGPPLRHSGLVVTAEFDSSGERLLTASADGTVRVWSLATQPLTITPWSDESARILTITRDGRTLAEQDGNHNLRLWNTETWEPIAPAIPLGGLAVRAYFSVPADRLLTIATTNGTSPAYVLRRWQISSAKALSAVELACTTNHAIAGSSNCARVALYDAHAVQTFDTTSGQPLFPAIVFDERVGRAEFSLDGQWLAVRAGNSLHILDSRTGTARCAPLQHEAELRDFEFSPDGNRVVAGTWDALLEPRMAQVWDLRTGAAVGAPMRHGDGIFHVHFSHDGTRVITASEDNTARIWDARSGQPVSPPFRHGIAVEDANVSPDGKWIGTSSHDQTARVWDAATGEPLTPRLKHGWPVDHVYFLAGRRYLLTQSGYSVRQVWVLPPDMRPADDLIALAQLMAGHAVDHTGALAPIDAATLQGLWQSLRTKYPRSFGL